MGSQWAQESFGKKVGCKPAFLRPHPWKMISSATMGEAACGGRKEGRRPRETTRVSLPKPNRVRFGEEEQRSGREVSPYGDGYEGCGACDDEQPMEGDTFRYCTPREIVTNSARYAHRRKGVSLGSALGRLRLDVQQRRRAA